MYDNRTQAPYLQQLKNVTEYTVVSSAVQTRNVFLLFSENEYTVKISFILFFKRKKYTYPFLVLQNFSKKSIPFIVTEIFSSLAQSGECLHTKSLHSFTRARKRKNWPPFSGKWLNHVARNISAYIQNHEWFRPAVFEISHSQEIKTITNSGNFLENE